VGADGGAPAAAGVAVAVSAGGVFDDGVSAGVASDGGVSAVGVAVVGPATATSGMAVTGVGARVSAGVAPGSVGCTIGTNSA
jgi:hypothetical protein